MATSNSTAHRIGWIGTGRMGYAMAERLVKAGCDLSIWNRTASKAAPLAALGAKIVKDLASLASSDILFTIVSEGSDLKEVLAGVTAKGAAPRIVVDCTSISIEDSVEVRRMLAARGTQLIAAPVSGNPKVIRAGKLTAVASGPRDAFDAVQPYFQFLGQGVSYVGEGELSRIAKICHNVMLGVVTQCLAEITILAQKAGMPRHAFLDFLNKSVLGSTFSRYKTPALVNLDFSVTFTPALLRKDLDLGLEAGRELGVPLPLASLTRDLVQTQIGYGLTDQDFSTLLLLEARASGIALEPERVQVGDGLEPQK
jgi:3-hydroxyisobutyrate dehydrogenase